MTNAQWDADQLPKEGMLAQIFSGASASVRTPTRDLQASREFNSHPQWVYASVATQCSGMNREPMSVYDHLSEGKRAMQVLERSRARAAEIRRFRDSTNWLSQNRSDYRGRWIALDGANLLAVHTSAKEVFAKIGGLIPPPLVIHVEEDETPFAGW